LVSDAELADAPLPDAMPPVNVTIAFAVTCTAACSWSYSLPVGGGGGNGTAVSPLTVKEGDTLTLNVTCDDPKALSWTPPRLGCTNGVPQCVLTAPAVNLSLTATCN
jgi:hypothetical protein